jgi:CDP-diacylglycerol--glycerol-3-phosphate 3-phosphatidyltransferase
MVENKNLADFFSEFMGKVQEFSLKVRQNGDVNLHDNWKLLPYQSSHDEFANEAKNRIQGFFHAAHEKQKLLMENNQG